MTFMAIAVLLSVSLANAQPQQDREQKTPEERIEMQAARVASELMLGDSQAEKFIPIYKAYRLDQKAINEKYRMPRRAENLQGTPLSDSEVDAKIRNGFAKSQAILDSRIAYYEKFLKVISPKQIQRVYDMEKEHADRAMPGKGGHHGGFEGKPVQPKKPAERR